MAEEFVKRGIKAVAVYSNAKEKYTEDRKKAIEISWNKSINRISKSTIQSSGKEKSFCSLFLASSVLYASPLKTVSQYGRGNLSNLLDYTKRKYFS